MLILASKSPRRKEILEMSKIPFKIIIEDVKEDVENSNPSEYVIKTSEKKALPLINSYPDDVILCCDTVVYIDNKILEKPHSKEEAFQMIKEIQGRSHFVLTGVYLGNIKKHDSFSVKTKVIVDRLSDQEIEEYVNTSEPYDKAGAYAIQGIFGKYIKGIVGDYYNVMGLPINAIQKKLKKFNI